MSAERLTARQRIQVAELSGAAQRLGIGKDRDLPRDQAVAELREISGDPAVLGRVLALLLYRLESESPGYAPAVDLVRAAGADEEAAAADLAGIRRRLNR